ncbi:MAG: choice-of-anchor Q domain-containing protein [Planctomycetota bacterium]|jgi:hypothetical protein
MKRTISISFAALFIIVGSAAAKDLLVPSEYKTIQAAINAAANGDTVIVADGTYTGSGNRDIDFKGKAITVMSENGPEKCIIDCQSDGRGFNFHKGEDANSVVDGFAITNGYATHGGGIFCSNASPRIIGCTITHNSAYHTGGISSTENSSPTISDCTITDNSCEVAAGGLGFFRSSVPPKVNKCIIAGNNSTRSGPGAIWCHVSSPIITNCVIAYNFGRSHSGGIQCTDSSPVITNCIISGNSSSYRPGGIHCDNASPIIRNCIISGNSADFGSGLYSGSASAPKIINCTISDNRSKYGGGIHCDFGSMTITNCIVWGNFPQAIVASRAFLEVTCSNIDDGWKGQDNISKDPLFVMDGPDAITGTWTLPLNYDPNTNRTTLTYANASFIRGQLVGRLIGVAAANARQALVTANTATTIEVVGDVSEYVTAGDSYRLIDYRLQNDSPCIDAGTAKNSSKTDIEGRPRGGNKPDIGAYEMAD